MNFRTISGRPVEPLQLVELEMQRLVERPVPQALYVGDLGEGLPDSWLDMAALRALLLHPSVGFQARGAVWVRLLHLTRADGRAGEEWRVATCGMALPGLWRIAGRMRREVPELAVEVQQVMLAGFWEALISLRERAHAMTAPGTIPASLCWSADRAARTFRNQESGHSRRTAELGEQETQQAAAPNPEAVLELAIGQGVLSRDAAELIARPESPSVICHRTTDGGRPWCAPGRDRPTQPATELPGVQDSCPAPSRPPRPPTPNFVAPAECSPRVPGCSSVRCAPSPP